MNRYLRVRGGGSASSVLERVERQGLAPRVDDSHKKETRRQYANARQVESESRQATISQHCRSVFLLLDGLSLRLDHKLPIGVLVDSL